MSFFVKILSWLPALTALTLCFSGTLVSADQERAVCDDSELSLLVKTYMRFGLVIHKDIAIPTNATTVALNDSCVIVLHEPWAQPRKLKARSYRAFITSMPLFKRLNPVTGQLEFPCKNGDRALTNSCKYESYGPFSSEVSYYYPDHPVEVLDLIVADDKTVASVTCRYANPFSKKSPIVAPKAMGHWASLLRDNGAADSTIGKAEACTKPIDALLGDQRKLDRVLANFGPGGLHDTKSEAETALKSVREGQPYDSSKTPVFQTGKIQL